MTAIGMRDGRGMIVKESVDELLLLVNSGCKFIKVTRQKGSSAYIAIDKIIAFEEE